MTEHQVTMTKTDNARRTKTAAFTITHADDDLVNYIAEHLGTGNRSDAVRTAVRSFAAHLAYLRGSRQG